MTPKSAALKLGLKPGGVLRLIAAPADAGALLGALPAGAEIVEAGEGPFPHVLFFARNSSALVRDLPRAKAVLAQGGALWIAYCKGASGHMTDINRDIIREHAMTLGIAAVGVISVDAQWSALRFKTV